MKENTKKNEKKKRWNDDGIVTELVRKFDKSKYETVMCIVAAGLFLIPAVKLAVVLAANFWMERLWVQCVQILAVVGLLAMTVYAANVYGSEPKAFGKKLVAVLKTHKWCGLALLFVVWMVISFFVNGCYLAIDSLYFSLFGTLSRNEGIFTRAIQMLLLMGFALVTDTGKKKRVVQVVLGESLFLMIPLLAQEWKWLAKITFLENNAGFQYMSQYGWHCSIFQHVNHYGYFLGMIVLLSGGMLYLAKSWKSKLLYGAVFVLNIMTLVYNNTFGSWLASFTAIVGVIVLFAVAKGKQTLKTGGLILGLFVLTTTVVSMDSESMWGQMGGLVSDVEDVATDSEDADEAGSGRWKVWKIAVGDIVTHPVFGGGEDCLIGVYGAAGYESLNRPANEYLQYAAFFGVPALLYYLGILLIIFVQKVKKIHKLPDITLVVGGAVLAYAISAFFGNTTIYTTTDFFVLLGLVAGDSAVIHDNVHKKENRISDDSCVEVS